MDSRTDNSTSSASDPSKSLASAIRDDKFYIENADCVILVDDTLFKIHRGFLTRDKSAFCDMFNLPQGQGPSSEGSDDLNPVVLVGDTVDEFRALCWVLYALPTEIVRVNNNTDKSDFMRLLHLATISHKYNFPTLEKWSMDIVVLNCSSGFNYSASCPAGDIETIFKAAIRTNRMDLRDLIEKIWISRLKAEPCLPALRALKFGDAHNMRGFLGEVYYIQAMRSFIAPPRDSLSSAPIPIPSPLGTPHDQRLLAGFYSLVMLWERFRTASSTFARSTSCGYRYCNFPATEVWDNAFSSPAVRNCRTTDIIGRIESVQAVQSEDSGDHCSACQLHSSETLSSYQADIKANLADHFLGPVTK